MGTIGYEYFQLFLCPNNRIFSCDGQEVNEFFLGKGVKFLLEKIKALCESKGVTVYRLEKDLGFSSGSVSKWDTNSPSVEKAKAVADYFGVSVESLLKQKNERN